MIKLKSLLNEMREKSHGWMTPSGTIIPVDDTHMTTAMKLVPNWRTLNIGPFEELWRKGYLRITYMYDGTLIAHNEKQQPNRKQLDILKDIAVKDHHGKIEWDNGKDLKILWTDQDFLEETKENVEIISIDDANEMGIDLNDLGRIERESGINILRDKEINFIAVINEKVVGGFYSSIVGDEYSFDIIVDKPYRRMGIGKKLINLGLNDFRQLEDELGLQLKLDVVNPHMISYLEKKGLKIIQQYPGHTIMTL